ncbi:WD40-repeat-containing domain protein [Dipodascopsis uninucleata]
MRSYKIESLARTTNVSIFYSVSFCPFQNSNSTQIFATIGDTFAIVGACGPGISGDGSGDADQKLEILSTYSDDNSEESLCSVCWLKSPVDGKPLLAIGGKSGVVKIIDCSTGKLVASMRGHGDEILDLQTSPTHPHIFASTSGDHTVRVWTLDPIYSSQPCIVICGGDCHREQVLTLAFHDSGRFILSGGMDNQVHLWALPNLDSHPTGCDEPLLLHWSHFSTSVLHSNYVDCVAFYGDLILSKAANEHRIVLWRIDGFSSSIADSLRQDNAPTNHDKSKDTLSAFGSGFTRLLQFSIPNTAPWYMRFGKITGSTECPPLIGMGSDSAKIYLFNLRSLEPDSVDESFDGPIYSDDESTLHPSIRQGADDQTQQQDIKARRKRKRRGASYFRPTRRYQSRQSRSSTTAIKESFVEEGGIESGSASEDRFGSPDMTIKTEDQDEYTDIIDSQKAEMAKKDNHVHRRADDIVDDNEINKGDIVEDEEVKEQEGSEYSSSGHHDHRLDMERSVYIDGNADIDINSITSKQNEELKNLFSDEDDNGIMSKNSLSLEDADIENTISSEIQATGVALEGALSSVNQAGLNVQLAPSASVVINEGTSVISDQFQGIRPHMTLEISKSKKLIRHIAFSPGGRYLIAVGDGGVICVWRAIKSGNGQSAKR